MTNRYLLFKLMNDKGYSGLLEQLLEETMNEYDEDVYEFTYATLYQFKEANPKLVKKLLGEEEQKENVQLAEDKER